MNTKEYNKMYYQKNKARVLEMMKKKVTCELCGRSVAHQNLMKHMETDYCKSRKVLKHHSEAQYTHKDIEALKLLIEGAVKEQEKEKELKQRYHETMKSFMEKHGLSA